MTHLQAICGTPMCHCTLVENSCFEASDISLGGAGVGTQWTQWVLIGIHTTPVPPPSLPDALAAVLVALHFILTRILRGTPG